MSEKCMLKEEPFHQCCCNCVYHWQDNHHCTTGDPEERVALGDGCICGQKKGYACVVFKIMDEGDGVIHSGWPEHSTGCEMYTAKEQTKKFDGTEPKATPTVAPKE